MGDPPSPGGVAAPADDAPAVDVVVDDEQSETPIDADRWAALTAAVCTAEGGAGEVTLTFVTTDEMATLNADHMGGDGPTDVLSFPLDAGDPPIAGEPVLIGDVVICPAVATAQADEHAGTIDDELALLVVHGCLHLFGHDHAEPDDTERMRARERELLVAHHWRGPVPTGFRQEHAGR